jgi:hypothetical protein
MGVNVELQNTGDSQACKEIVAVIEHALSDKPGEWSVSIVGSRASDNWEMKIQGPSRFERSYYFGWYRGRTRTGGNTENAC